MPQAWQRVFLPVSPPASGQGLAPEPQVSLPVSELEPGRQQRALPPALGLGPELARLLRVSLPVSGLEREQRPEQRASPPASAQGPELARLLRVSLPVSPQELGLEREQRPEQRASHTASEQVLELVRQPQV
ncbi:MAG: hypothetical protein J6334_09270, partial [Kiritimatiellae bacterium]|nr:hypothetical protein [Kiritimatiellia bacterium]